MRSQVLSVLGVAALAGCSVETIREGEESGLARVDAGPALTVSLDAPTPDASVSGVVTVSASVTGEVTRVDLLVDGMPADDVLAPPFVFAWDTATAHANPFPAPSHALLFGYYYADGRYGDHTAEVNGFTNAYVGDPGSYDTSKDWHPLFAQSLAEAHAAGRVMYLGVGDPTLWDDVLNEAGPYWSDVQLLEIADEPGWDQATMESTIASYRMTLANHGLGDRPIGYVDGASSIQTSGAPLANGLDWVGIEAYVNGPGSPTAQTNIDAMKAEVQAAEAAIPAGKQVGLVMQAYDRNGTWTDMSTLAALQGPTYLLAASDPRVIFITMFSYARPGGSRDHPELKAVHQAIGEKILGVPVPALSNGPHQLTVNATGVDLSHASASVTVQVNNP